MKPLARNSLPGPACRVVRIGVAFLCLLAGYSVPARAQISCQATATPFVVRAEGIAELVADLLLTCSPSPAFSGENYRTVSLTVDLNVNVTNNRGFGFGIDVTDAVLVVNENHTAGPTRFSTLGGPDPRFPLPQLGRLASDTRLVWDQVRFPLPGASDFPDTTTLRLTNIRANASQLNSSSEPPPAVTASISASGTLTLQIPSPPVSVAVPSPGLSAGIGNGVAPGSFLLRFREGFESAFKLLGMPSFTPGIPSREAGYPTPFSGANGGGATQSTRLRLGFTNVPTGLEIRVPDQIPNGDPVFFDRVMNADANCAGGFLISGPGMQLVAVSSGSGFACYELVRIEDPTALEEAEITIQTAGGSFTGVGVSVSLAPTSTLATSESGEPIPRFVPGEVLNRAGLRIVSGNEQSAPEGTALPIPLTVQLTDGTGFGVAGVEVTFSLREGNQQAPISTVVTDAVGWASQTITLPRFPRVIEIVASAPGFDPLTFTLTSEPDSAPGIVGPRVNAVIGAGMSVPSVEQTSQNAIISVFGENFVLDGTEMRVSEDDIVDGLLPFELANTCVQVGRTVGRLFFVSATQIDVQVPRQNVDRDGLVQVIKNCGDSDEIRSTIRDIALRSTSPEFFFFTLSPDGQNPIAAINESTSRLVGPPGLLPGIETAPARAGDIVTVFMTGLGETTPVFETGQLADQAAEAVAPVRVFVNGEEVEIFYAGVTPGSAGLYQVSFVLSEGTTPGQAAVRVQAGDFSTPPGGFLAVE